MDFHYLKLLAIPCRGQYIPLTGSPTDRVRNNIKTALDTRQNVEDDVFDYIAGKTKDDNPKTISVPLVTMAKKILKRYESSGRATILPFISEQKYNDAIKAVFRLA